MMTGIVGSACLNTVPKQISSLACWLDGTDPSGNNVAPSDGTSIATWVDKSANAINPTQATGSQQAVFTTNIINSKAGMLFSSAASRLYQKSAVRIFDNINNYYIYSVVRPTAFTTSNVIIEGGNGASTGIYVLMTATTAFGRLTDRSPYAVAAGDTIITASAVATANNNFILQFSRDASGGNQTVTSSNAVTANLTPLTQPALPASDMLFTIGTNGGGPVGNYFNGYMGEVVVFTSFITTAQKNVVNNYLRQKWSITP